MARARADSRRGPIARRKKTQLRFPRFLRTVFEARTARPSR